MDKTIRLIRWQRITIAVLFLASLSMALTAAHHAHTSEERLQESQRWQQRASQYEAEMQRFRLTSADIEYLQWFKEFDQSCRKMSKQQAEAIGRELHSSKEDSLEPVTAAAAYRWLQAQARFRQKSPPPACEALAAAYAERLSLMTGQVQEHVSIQMMISSRGYNIDSPQGRKWAKVPEINWERQNADQQRLRDTTGHLNAALEQIARTPGAPLPQDLAKLRVHWVGILLD